MTKQRISLIRLFVFTGNILLPVYAFLWVFLGNNRGGVEVAFAIFVSLMIVERAWETFKTSKEQHREELHGDWTLVLVTTTYLILFFLFITEFYTITAQLKWSVIAVGSALLIGSFIMRFWGMASLGEQWAVHAVGAQKIRKVSLIKIGPYKFIRHPIYTGIILEVLAYPLIANAYYSFLFSILVCVPAIVLRARVEESYSVRRFGAEYDRYKKEVGMFFPIQILSDNKP